MFKKKPILIDGRVLKHSAISGVERYTIEIVDGLKAIMADDIDIAVPSVKNSWQQHLWEHTSLYAKSRRYKLLFCPANVCPIVKPKGVKFVTTIHDLSFFDYPDSFSLSYRLYYNLLAERVLKLSDAVITVSNFEKDELIKKYPLIKEKIYVIYSGVSKEFLNCSVNYKKKDYILYVGNLSKRKNFHGLIKAFSKIYKEIGKKLIVVGVKPKIMRLDDSVEKILADIPDEYIEFRGQINDINTLKELYKNTSTFLFPSLYESFGFPALEAMACGAPVIASNKAAMPEICKDAALYVDPLNIDDICDKISMLNSKTDLRTGLIEKGKARAKLFSWNRTVREHEGLVQKFI